MNFRVERQLTVINKLGLHARAAIKLVELGAQYQSLIEITDGDKQVTADSVMGLLMLEAFQGKQVQVITKGPDALEAMDAVQQLFESRFDEDE